MYGSMSMGILMLGKFFDHGFFGVVMGSPISIAVCHHGGHFVVETLLYSTSMLCIGCDLVGLDMIRIHSKEETDES